MHPALGSIHSESGQLHLSGDMAHGFTKTSRNCQKWVLPKIGVPPNHPILIGFSIINHPFWGTSIFGNTQIFTARLQLSNNFLPNYSTISRLLSPCSMSIKFQLRIRPKTASGSSSNRDSSAALKIGKCLAKSIDL